MVSKRQKGLAMQILRRTSLLLSSVAVCIETVGAQAPAFTTKQIAPNVWAAIANPNGSAGGNAGFVIGDDGVVVIDTFVSTEAAKQLLAEIQTRTKLPVKFVVNTHYHADHVAGNRVFTDAGAVVLAHRHVRSWIQTENLRLLGTEGKPELKAFIAGFVVPTIVYDEGVDLFLGLRRIQVRSFLGHTGGDSVVIVPDAKAVFAGDLLWRNASPNLIDATTASWVQTLDTLAKSESGSTFVPGHGDVGSAQDVTAFREYLTILRKLVADAQNQGKSGDALTEAVMPELTARYGKWDFFKYLAPRNIMETAAELSGKKRVPQADMGK
jgi:cyclase